VADAQDHVSRVKEANVAGQRLQAERDRRAVRLARWRAMGGEGDPPGGGDGN
jgi:hypothetical protein